MTRDEAVKTLQDATVSRTQAETFVHCANALGLLKLEEPKDRETRLAEALGWPAGGRSEGELRDALMRAGLRIVEANQPTIFGSSWSDERGNTYSVRNVDAGEEGE